MPKQMLVKITVSDTMFGDGSADEAVATKALHQMIVDGDANGSQIPAYLAMEPQLVYVQQV